MGMQQKVGIGAVIFGVLLLVIGLVFSGMIIDGVNKQGGKIGCYDSDDNQIKSAKHLRRPRTQDVRAGSPYGVGSNLTPVPGDSVPSKVSKAYQGPNVVDKVCGTNVQYGPNPANYSIAAFESPIGCYAPPEPTAARSATRLRSTARIRSTTCSR